MSIFEEIVKENLEMEELENKSRLRKYEEEKLLLEISHLKKSIFHLKNWWLLLVINAIVSIAVSLIVNFYQ